MKTPFDICRAALAQSQANMAAARANLDAAESAQNFALEMLAALEPDEAGPGTECKHEDKDNMGTLANPDRWRCRTCGYYHDGAAEPGNHTEE